MQREKSKKKKPGHPWLKSNSILGNIAWVASVVCGNILGCCGACVPSYVWVDLYVLNLHGYWNVGLCGSSNLASKVNGDSTGVIVDSAG